MIQVAEDVRFKRSNIRCYCVELEHHLLRFRLKMSIRWCRLSSELVFATCCCLSFVDDTLRVAMAVVLVRHVMEEPVGQLLKRVEVKIPLLLFVGGSLIFLTLCNNLMRNIEGTHFL